MTDEEIVIAEERINKAKLLKRRIAAMKDGAAKLSDKRINGLKIPLTSSNDAIEARYAESDRWFSVCWSRDEADLPEEIIAALLAILAGRIEKLSDELRML